MRHIYQIVLLSCLCAYTNLYAQQNDNNHSACIEEQSGQAAQLYESNSDNAESTMVISTAVVWNSNQQIYDDIIIANGGQLTIQGNTQMMGSNIMTVQSGGKLIVDGGNLSNVDLTLNSGSSLEMINGGILESRSGFSAPVGASVVITEGKIS